MSPKAEKTTTAQFNFISFDELVPHLPKFRENFPNIEHFEFTETNICRMNQINALALVQGKCDNSFTLDFIIWIASL